MASHAGFKPINHRRDLFTDPLLSLPHKTECLGTNSLTILSMSTNSKEIKITGLSPLSNLLEFHNHQQDEAPIGGIAFLLTNNITFWHSTTINKMKHKYAELTFFTITCFQCLHPGQALHLPLCLFLPYSCPLHDNEPAKIVVIKLIMHHTLRKQPFSKVKIYDQRV